jgi:hypothetical protein
LLINRNFNLKKNMKRSTIKEFELPKKSDIETSKTLIAQKTWFNYVFKGKGYLKALNRARLIIPDLQLIKAETRAILDVIISDEKKVSD